MVTKLTLEYDGTGFAGWAAQPGLRTVQETLEAPLRRLLGRPADALAAVEPGADEAGADEPGAEPGAAEPLSLTVAGRTDRGVHAWGQVASYRGDPLEPARLNALLPDDVAVLRSEPVAADFDARRNARSRTYCYRVLARRERSVFLRGRALWWRGPLDREALRACADLLPGLHDFTAFTPAQSDHVLFRRRVRRAEWREDGDLLELWIEAETFMRHMNRVIVGTMLEVASGRRTLEGLARLLEGRPRSEAGPTAPAHGLALAAVSYSE